MNNLFLKYFFISNCFIHGIKSELHGGVNQNIHAENIKNQLIGIPPLSEQTAIADFLDQKTGEIDLAVKKGEERIRLLKEYRAAVIHEAVTRGVPADIAGIDQGVEMKESGIEYIGEIPKHWEVVKLKYCSIVQTGITPSSTKEEFYYPPEIDWYAPGDFRDDIYLKNSKRKISELAIQERAGRLFPANSVLLVGIGATLGKIGIILNEGSSNQQINAITFKENYYSLYGAYFLSSISESIASLSNASTLAILNQSQTKDISVPFPPIEEQRQIVEYIETETARLDAEIRTAEEEIRLLQEYREALISEAVTGKIDVRDYPLN